MKPAALSIRTRIQLWNGLLLACILVALGVAAWRLRWDDELQRVDRELNEVLSQIHRILGSARPAALRGNAATPSPPEQFTMPAEITAQIAARGCYYAHWTRNGKLVAHSDNVPAALAMPKLVSGGTVVTHWRSSGDAREGYVFTPLGECIFAGVSVAQECAAMVRFGWWLVALGAGVLAHRPSRRCMDRAPGDSTDRGHHRCRRAYQPRTFVGPHRVARRQCARLPHDSEPVR